MKERHTDVIIVGGGPIGLTAALLLSRHGVRSILCEKRDVGNPHPRSRSVDVCTMELMREIGIDRDIASTGLGPDWTSHLRWFDNLSRPPIVSIPSPTFHSIARQDSPTIPVMTTQDQVESLLLERAQTDPNIDLRFRTEAVEITQSANATRALVRSDEDGRETTLTAPYLIGADGVRSTVRDAINCPLEANFMDVYFKDVIFEAPLDQLVKGHEASLFFVAHPMGTGVFQPLDGKELWRCQIGQLPPDFAFDETYAKEWIRSAAGVKPDFPIDVKSITKWQFMPGTAKRFSSERIFLAGDAAHVFIPAGGLGNNTGFLGIRNLAWKLAYVCKGFAGNQLLETYEAEMRPVVEGRIAAGTENAQLVTAVFQAMISGSDAQSAGERARQYADCDRLVMGYRMGSTTLVSPASQNQAAPSSVDAYQPVIKAGARAPHCWLDQEQSKSLFDFFGTGFVCILGPETPLGNWEAAVDRPEMSKLPLSILKLPKLIGTQLYREFDAVLVRPDGVIAASTRRDEAGMQTPTEFLELNVFEMKLVSSDRSDAEHLRMPNKSVTTPQIIASD